MTTQSSSTTVGEVVVGFDGSPDAHGALDWGRHEAMARKARLRVVVVVGFHDWAVQARDILAASAATQWDVEVRPGDPRDVLTEASGPGSVIVVGSTGHSRVAGVLLGSVSQHLARHATGPVVVVRGDTERAPGPVVVGVDGSPASQRALDFALAHAGTSDSTVTAVYGWDASMRKGTPLAGEVPAEVAHETLEAERWLAEAVSGHAERYPDVKLDSAAVPRPVVPTLVDASTTAALLVVGSRGRGAVEGILLGSVSQEVLHRAHCPVAIVP